MESIRALRVHVMVDAILLHILLNVSHFKTPFHHRLWSIVYGPMWQSQSSIMLEPYFMINIIIKDFMVILTVKSNHLSITLSVGAKEIVMLSFMVKILLLSRAMIGELLLWQKIILETMVQLLHNIPRKTSMAKRILLWLLLHPLSQWGQFFKEFFIKVFYSPRLNFALVLLGN